MADVSKREKLWYNTAAPINTEEALVRRIGTLVAVATMVLTTGCGNAKKDTAPPSQSATSPSASAAQSPSSPPTDLTINGVSLKDVLNVVATFASDDFTLVIATADAPVNCDGLTVAAELSSTAFCRKERTVVVPFGLQKAWSALPPAVIWYLVATEGIHASHAVFNTDLRVACSAGYITARMPGFDVPATTSLREFITKHQGDGHLAAADQGISIWLHNQTMTTCGTYGPDA